MGKASRCFSLLKVTRFFLCSRPRHIATLRHCPRPLLNSTMATSDKPLTSRGKDPRINGGNNGIIYGENSRKERPVPESDRQNPLSLSSPSSSDSSLETPRPLEFDTEANLSTTNRSTVTTNRPTNESSTIKSTTTTPVKINRISSLPDALKLAMEHKLGTKSTTNSIDFLRLHANKMVQCRHALVGAAKKVNADLYCCAAMTENIPGTIAARTTKPDNVHKMVSSYAIIYELLQYKDHGLPDNAMAKLLNWGCLLQPWKPS